MEKHDWLKLDENNYVCKRCGWQAAIELETECYPRPEPPLGLIAQLNEQAARRAALANNPKRRNCCG